MQALVRKYAEMPPLELRALQDQRVRDVVHFHYYNNPTYRALCAQRGVVPEDIESVHDLRLLPIVERDFLQRYGFYKGAGGALSVEPQELFTFLNSSGSTGKPKRIPIAVSEVGEIYETSALGLWLAGVRGGDFREGGGIYTLFPHGPWPGSFFLMNASEAIGFAPKADLGMPFPWHLNNLRELRPKTIVTSPSVISALASFMGETGTDPRTLGVTRIVLGGEFFSDNFRATIEERFRARVLDLYGCGETQIVTVESDDLYEQQRGFMYHLAHMSVIETVCPGTEEPVQPGEDGEMVITVFNRKAWPVVRYRMGDIVALQPEEQRPEGLCYTFPIISRIRGRSDDMLKYGNVNLYPELFFNVLAEFNRKSNILKLSGDKFRFEIFEHDDPCLLKATWTIELEGSRQNYHSQEAFRRSEEELLDALVAHSDELRHALFVGRQVPPPTIQLVDAGTLYQNSMKLRRMVDHRQHSGRRVSS